MSASLFAEPAFTVPLPRNRLDLAGMLGDPQIAPALRTAIDDFARAIRDNRPEDRPG